VSLSLSELAHQKTRKEESWTAQFLLPPFTYISLSIDQTYTHKQRETREREREPTEYK
jgi:hypothetical protein